MDLLHLIYDNYLINAYFILSNLLILLGVIMDHRIRNTESTLVTDLKPLFRDKSTSVIVFSLTHRWVMAQGILAVVLTILMLVIMLVSQFFRTIYLGLAHLISVIEIDGVSLVLAAISIAIALLTVGYIKRHVSMSTAFDELKGQE